MRGRRGRCWLCGRALEAGARVKVCAECVGNSEGLCTSCSARNSCGELYGAAMDDGKWPRYPPCVVPTMMAAPGWLVREQRRVYGVALVGRAAIYLAGCDHAAWEEHQRSTVAPASILELARRWGARCTLIEECEQCQ